MKVFIVYSCYHYDDYKRAHSASEVHRVFTNEEKAYDFANKKLLLMFDEYAKYNSSECKTHIIDEYFKLKNGWIQCEECGIQLNKDGTVDLDDKNNLFSKEHIISVINDTTKSKKEIYDWIQDNLYNNILCEPDYTMMPTHLNYFVISKTIDNDDED
jgi:hypothetical protein